MNWLSDVLNIRGPEMILQVVERVLSAGCNISLSEGLSSERFQQLRKTQDSLLQRYSARSHRGIALRAGHLVMGELFNTMPEKEALHEARSRRAEFGSKLEHRALVQLVGEKIVEAAGKCLPPEAKELAEQWKVSDASDQIGVARELYELFRSECQGDYGKELTLAYVRDDLWRKLSEGDGIQCCLPGLYGQWNKKTCPANCQGKSQMLTAFARSVDIPVMVASLVHCGRKQADIARNKARLAVSIDLARRGLENADACLAESMEASVWDSLSKRFTRHFHLGVALKLRDGNWVLLDPNGLAWGVFVKEQGVAEVHALLQKYSEVLPGLQVMRHDGGHCQKVLRERGELFRDILDRSRKMEERIKARNPENALELTDVVLETDDMEFLWNLLMEHEGRPPMDFSYPELRKCVATVVIMGGEDKLFDWSLHLNPDFLPMRIKEWLTWYHAVAMNLFGEQLARDGKLVYPVCDFGLPEYHLAISALNSVSCEIGHEHRFFLDYSFDQVSLFNATLEHENGDSVAAQAAKSTLTALPFRHELCDLKLGLLR